MRAWSIQTPEVWETLQRDGVYRLAAPGRGSEHFAAAYRWMAGQLARRVGPPPVGCAWPLWAWVQWEGAARPRPDLRRGAHLPRGTSGVRLTLEIDPAALLLSDFELWHYVIWQRYLPGSEADATAFEQALATAGLDDIPFDQLPDPYRGRVTASWERIFDLTWDDVAFAYPRDRKSIQAVLWELRRDQVRRVDRFRAR